MKLAFGFIILLLSIICIAIEFIIYLFVPWHKVLSGGDIKSFALPPAILIWLVVSTLIVGISAPVAGAIEQFVDRKNLGSILWIFIILVGSGLTFIFTVFPIIISGK